jgi:hypothetical protein
LCLVSCVLCGADRLAQLRARGAAVDELVGM